MTKSDVARKPNLVSIITDVLPASVTLLHRSAIPQIYPQAVRAAGSRVR
jgi:hypothetical protein